MLGGGLCVCAVLCDGYSVHDRRTMGTQCVTGLRCCSMATSMECWEEEYLEPRAVYEARFVDTAGYVAIETTTLTHRNPLCPQALQSFHDLHCPCAAAVLDRAQVEGAVAVLRVLLVLCASFCGRR